MFGARDFNPDSIVKVFTKMKIIKPAIFICLLLLNCISAFSQGFKDRFVHSVGYTIVLDFFQLPSTSQVMNGYNHVTTLQGLSVVTYSYKPRINIVDFNDNTSLDIHAEPALGISISPTNDNNQLYVGSFSLPLMVGVNFGNVSTYKTDKNMGFGIAAGYEYLNGGLVKVSDDNDNTANAKRSTFEPVSELSVRYWSRTNKAREISLIGGWGSKNAADVDYSDSSVPPLGTISGSFHFRLLWSFYLDY